MALAQRLECDDRFAAVYSLAGRTSAPRLPALPCRRGGFGGVAGLLAYLREEGIELIVDATHPFAAGMSRNAAEASRQSGIPLLVLSRPPWTPEPGDRWTCVSSLEAAAGALGDSPRRVFLTTGKTELTAFISAPHHFFLLRSVEPPEQRPPRSTFIQAKGPFSVGSERALLASYRIDTLVTKNAGGPATAAKLQAARLAGVAVIIVERPPSPGVGQIVPDVGAAHQWLEHYARRSRPTERGV